MGVAKRLGWGGVAAGAAALIACELPFALALVGFGGLGAAAAAIAPPPVVEWIAVSLAVAGVSLLIPKAVARRRARRGDP